MGIMKIVLVFIVTINFVSSSEESCKKHYECKRIDECPRMFQLLLNKNAGDLEFLRKSNCGYVGDTPMVCCPKLACRTPGGMNGDCMPIHDCPAIKSLSQSFKSTSSTKTSNTRNYILKSHFRCLHIEKGVCCPFPSRTTQVELKPQYPKQNCLASDLPPNPESNCCGVEPELGHRISRGAPTLWHQYTWLAILEYDGNAHTSCVGSLISGLFVLTAAHCVSQKTPVSVLLGEYDRNNPGRGCKESNDAGENCMESQRIHIDKTIMHPNFSQSDGPPFMNDIALLQLSRANFGEFIRPICLPSKSSMPVRFGQNLKLTSAGWGETENQHYGSDVKLAVELPLVETSDCGQKFNVPLGDGHMCVGNMNGEGPCSGDSGGPLMHHTGDRFEAVGVHSFGVVKCGVKRWPHVFTNVLHYLPWINKTIQKISYKRRQKKRTF